LRSPPFFEKPVAPKTRGPMNLPVAWNDLRMDFERWVGEVSSEQILN